jgi:phage terminase large subunit-like protein
MKPWDFEKRECEPHQTPITLPCPHERQIEFIQHPAKRKVIRAGRRGGKTVGVAIHAVLAFYEGRRVLYAAPTADQVGRFWTEVSRACAGAVASGALRSNVTEHMIDRPGTENRIRAKTAWNADSLRGDYADLLILDEYQLMDETAWEEVGAPMLLDNNGDAVFIYTPPSLSSRSVSKAKDPQHAAKLFRRAATDTTGRWATFHFGSGDNPHIDKAALAEIARDMTALAYRQEILAEDVESAPGALWTRETCELHRVPVAPASLVRVVVGLDPSATTEGDEAGIMAAGMDARGHAYLLADHSRQGSPKAWATAAVNAMRIHDAGEIVVEINQGGEMCAQVIHGVDKNALVFQVRASKGKQPRAQPIAARAEAGMIHHVGHHPKLEDELCMWVPGDKSPNRLDAYTWAMARLFGVADGTWSVEESIAEAFSE